MFIVTFLVGLLAVRGGFKACVRRRQEEASPDIDTWLLAANTVADANLCAMVHDRLQPPNAPSGTPSGLRDLAAAMTDPSQTLIGEQTTQANRLKRWAEGQANEQTRRRIGLKGGSQDWKAYADTLDEDLLHDLSSSYHRRLNSSNFEQLYAEGLVESGNRRRTEHTMEETLDALRSLLKEARTEDAEDAMPAFMYKQAAAYAWLTRRMMIDEQVNGAMGSDVFMATTSGTPQDRVIGCGAIVNSVNHYYNTSTSSRTNKKIEIIRYNATTEWIVTSDQDLLERIGLSAATAATFVTAAATTVYKLAEVCQAYKHFRLMVL